MNVKALIAALGLGLTLSANAAIDPKLPEYTKASGVSGNMSSVGSDTLANLMTFWAEDFKKSYPNVNIQIQAAGSSTAPPAMTEGTANLGPMSRKMKDAEIEAFEKKKGYKPTAVPVAIDALAVFVLQFVRQRQTATGQHAKADLVKAGSIADPRHKFQPMHYVRHVQRHDQAVICGHHGLLSWVGAV